MIPSPSTPKSSAAGAVPCLICGKAGPGPLCCLHPSHLARHEAEGRIQTYRRGQVIFYAGNVPLALYGLFAGMVKVAATTKSGMVQILRIEGPGDILGYRALLAGETYAATAEAIADAKVATLPRERVFAAIRRSPETALWFLAKLSRELRISEEQMVACMHLPVRRRTARLLLTLLASGPAPPSPGRGEGRMPAIDLAISRTEMAQMIGVAPETLSRTLRAFADEGILALDGSRITVRRLAALGALAREPPREP